MWRSFFAAMTATFITDLFLSQINDSTSFGTLSQPGMLTFGAFTTRTRRPVRPGAHGLRGWAVAGLLEQSSTRQIW